MKIKKNKTELKTVHVISKDDKVYIKSKTDSEKWHPVNFQWMPVFST